MPNSGNTSPAAFWKNNMNLTKETIKLFWHHATRYRWRLVGIAFAIPFAVFMLDFLPPLIIADILERLASHQYEVGKVWESFGWDLVIYGLVAYSGAVVGWRLVSVLIWTLETNVMRDLHNKAFKHLMQLDTNFHANNFGGSLASQANKLASGYVNIQDATLFEVAPLVLSILFSAVLLTPKAPIFVGALLVISAIFVMISIRMAKRIRELSAEEAKASNAQTGYLADAIANIAAVKSFATSRHEETRYREATEARRTAELRIMRATQVQQVVFASTTTFLGVIALVSAVISVVMFKADVSTVFLVVTYTMVVGQGLWHFSGQTLRAYNRGFGDARAMVEILNQQPSVQDPSKPQKVRISKGAIRFKDVTFAHADTTDALFHQLNIEVPAGRKIGLVGHSGSGKTSLTRLLLRFVDVDSGTITIDGQDIAKISQDDLRRNIAYVPQEPLLFHRSLRENIAYGQPDATDSEIREAARKAHAAEFIERLPRGYDTEVGERGVKLSGGQRQRIAIARAILKNAPILVLDEATSALDSESERLIQAALWELMQGRTAIVIAHRLSTIQRMDQIIVLDNGIVIEQGSHSQLLAQGGTYADLWAHQSGGFIEE